MRKMTITHNDQSFNQPLLLIILTPWLSVLFNREIVEILHTHGSHLAWTRVNRSGDNRTCRTRWWVGSSLSPGTTGGCQTWCCKLAVDALQEKKIEIRVCVFSRTNLCILSLLWPLECIFGICEKWMKFTAMA